MDLKDLSLSTFLEMIAKMIPEANKNSRETWLHQYSKARALENDWERLQKENEILRQELAELQQQGGFQ